MVVIYLTPNYRFYTEKDFFDILNRKCYDLQWPLLQWLEKQPDLYKRYADFFGEFFHLGHMEKVPTSEVIKPVENCYYLCHHCVFKESSTTTKLRVVFDGSAKTTTGVSLNDRLMVEPKLQKRPFQHSCLIATTPSSNFCWRCKNVQASGIGQGRQRLPQIIVERSKFRGDWNLSYDPGNIRHCFFVFSFNSTTASSCRRDNKH